MHDPTLVLLGSRLSSIIEITEENGSPFAFRAGHAVCLTPHDQLSFGYETPLIGITMGPGLKDCEKTSVARVGNEVPLKLKDRLALIVVGSLIFVAAKAGESGNLISVEIVDLLVNDTAEVVVVDQSILIMIKGGVTSAQTIYKAVTESIAASGLVNVSVEAGEESTPQDAADETFLVGGSNYNPFIGEVVKIDPDTGLASPTGIPTASYFQSERKNGVYPDRTSFPCGLVSLIGGFQ